MYQRTGVDETVERILTATDYQARRRVEQAVVRTAVKKLLAEGAE